MSDISDIIKQRKGASYNWLSANKYALYDKVEELAHGILNDGISSNAKSHVSDPKLETLNIERAYRVMGQMGIGKVKGMSGNDQGDAKLKNLLLEKYILPNANAQFDFLTKLRLVDMYSNQYGSFDVLVDQDVKKSGYIGPDMWLLPVRDVFEQAGCVFEDADHVIVRTWKSLSYFEGLTKQQGFKNISTIIAKLKELSGSKQSRESNAKSKREEDQYPNSDPAKKAGFFECLTQFEGDRWVDICVDADMDFRDIKNPHDNGEIPVVRKYSMPLLDDPRGRGDFERGASMQMAMNGNWNLYFDGIKLSNEPPVIINKDNVASISSFQRIPGAMWLGRGASVDNIARPIQLSPQGITTFNNTHQVANASLLSLFGTSDTAVSAQTDPGFGKTPQALQMQAARENTRDNADRFYMEQFITKVMKKMVNLLNKKQNSAISFRMFPDEIEQIARDYPEIKDQYDEKTGKLTVKKGRNSTLYDYEIVSGSTYAVDQKQQQQNLSMLLDLWMKSQTPQGNMLEQQLKAQGFNLKFGELMKRIISSSGIQDWDKILEEMTVQEQGENSMQQAQQQFQQVLQQMQGQPDMNAVPPMPNGQVQPTPPQAPGQMPPQGGMPPQMPPNGGMQ